jgi:hypothetical protein
MTTSPTPVRFFWFVLRSGPTVAAAALLTAAASVYLLRSSADRFDEAAPLALVVQMFAASTGFRDPAGRGHFDPILSGRRDRLAIACAHGVVSNACGAAMWIVLGLADFMFRPQGRPIACAPASLAAFLYVSSLCWAATLRFGRYSAGTMWCVTLFALSATPAIRSLSRWYVTSPQTWLDTIRSLAAALVCPPFLVGRPDAASPLNSCLVLLTALAAAVAGVRTIEHFDCALREPA